MRPLEAIQKKIQRHKIQQYSEQRQNCVFKNRISAREEQRTILDMTDQSCPLTAGILCRARSLIVMLRSLSYSMMWFLDQI